MGIQSNKETYKENIGGSDPGAPKNPKIGIKFLITTIYNTVNQKRDVQLILNFDEGGDWILFDGGTKDVAGRKDTVLGEELTTIEITKDNTDEDF